MFVRKTVAPYLERHPDRSEFEVLAHDLEKERSAGFAKAQAAVEGDRFRRLLLDCALWLIDGKWRNDSEDLMRRLRDRSAKCLTAPKRSPSPKCAKAVSSVAARLVWTRPAQFLSVVVTDGLGAAAVNCPNGDDTFSSLSRKTFTFASIDALTLLEPRSLSPVRVVAFNTGEGWSRDVTEEIGAELAKAWLAKACADRGEMPPSIADFIAEHSRPPSRVC